MYRAINNFSFLYPYLINYVVEMGFSLSNLTDDISTVNISSSLMPDSTMKIITWDTISTTMIKGEDYSSWGMVNAHWSSMNPVFTNNGYDFPAINGNNSYNLYYDHNTNVSRNSFDMVLSDGVMGYMFSITTIYYHASGTFDVVFDSIKNIDGRIISEDVNLFDNNGVMTNVITFGSGEELSFKGFMVSVGAIKYNLLHGIKVESSSSNALSDEYEIYNNNNSQIEIEILLVN